MKETFHYERKILNHYKKSVTTKFHEKEKESLWIRIEQSIDKKNRKRNIFRLHNIWAVAATICLLISLGGTYLLNNTRQKEAMICGSSPVITEPFTKPNEAVRLIAVDGSEIIFDGGEPEVIAQNYNKPNENSPEDNFRLNQLIVPSGKKSYLLLEDGTRLWINSDTKIIYPEKFDTKERVITVNGEIYADVAEEKDRPFIVNTQSLKIQVLGTKFNLTAYNEDKKQRVILVSGKVEVNPKGFDPVVLQPNSMLAVVNNQLELKKNIDVYDYTCWKDNLLVLNAVTFSELISKLNRYYDCEIISDTCFNNRILSGKLDLKNDLENVIRSLSISLKYSYEIKGNKVFIHSK
jgi:hypothetical protein